MLNFLLDITPDKSQLLITIKLAGILREKKQEVYYTYTSNPAFTPVLYNKGISNCVLYPDDFRWLKPDLTLLDCRHAAHASLYRQLAIDYIFIAMQLPDQKNIIRKTKCFDFWERNVLFPKTKRSFFRTPKHPLPCPFPLNFSLLIITKKFGNLAKNRYICIV